MHFRQWDYATLCFVLAAAVVRLQLLQVEWPVPIGCGLVLLLTSGRLLSRHWA